MRASFSKPDFIRKVEDLTGKAKDENELPALHVIIADIDFKDSRNNDLLDYLSHEKTALERTMRYAEKKIAEIEKAESSLKKLSSRFEKSKNPVVRSMLNKVLKNKKAHITKLKDAFNEDKNIQNISVYQRDYDSKKTYIENSWLPKAKISLREMALGQKQMLKLGAKSLTKIPKLSGLLPRINLYRTSAELKNEKIKFKKVAGLIEDFNDTKEKAKQNEIMKKLAKLLPEVVSDYHNKKRQDELVADWGIGHYQSWLNQKNYLAEDKSHQKLREVKQLVSEIKECDREIAIHDKMTRKGKVVVEYTLENKSTQKALLVEKLIEKCPQAMSDHNTFKIKDFEKWIKKSEKKTNAFKEGFKHITGHFSRKASQIRE